MRRFSLVTTLLLACGLSAAAIAKDDLPENKPIRSDGTYTAEEIVDVASGFFGETTEGLAKVVERVFAEQGQPNAYISGEEASGAVGVGLRYGRGTLNYKDGTGMPVFWQGPSVGWDLGGNASKVFTLVYKLRNTNDLFQRFPGVDGSLYFLAGAGVNYQKSGEITLAPIRTGVGLRAGASVGYLHYTVKQSWVPF
ncbi:MAG: DUF1134 domain-containing protein [Panacagrimonas sp.]